MSKRDDLDTRVRNLRDLAKHLREEVRKNQAAATLVEAEAYGIQEALDVWDAAEAERNGSV